MRGTTKHTHWRSALVAGALCLALPALSGCGGGGDCPPPPPPPPPAVEDCPCDAPLILGDAGSDARADYAESAPAVTPEPAAESEEPEIARADVDADRRDEKSEKDETGETPVWIQVQVLDVIDGGTLQVLWINKPVTVTLLDVDAPMPGEDGFDAAQERLRELVKDGAVDLQLPDGDATPSDGILEAEIWVDGVNVTPLLRAELAVDSADYI